MCGECVQELTELRHALSRTKKSLQDKSAELEHAKSRAEQYELEVKKLRLRIEELKRDLTAAEDLVSHDYRCLYIVNYICCLVLSLTNQFKLWIVLQLK